MERRNICFGRNYATRALDDAAVGLNSLGARGALDGGFPAAALIRGSFDGKTGTGGGVAATILVMGDGAGL